MTSSRIVVLPIVWLALIVLRFLEVRSGAGALEVRNRAAGAAVALGARYLRRRGRTYG